MPSTLLVRPLIAGTGLTTLLTALGGIGDADPERAPRAAITRPAKREVLAPSVALPEPVALVSTPARSALARPAAPGSSAEPPVRILPAAEPEALGDEPEAGPIRIAPRFREAPAATIEPREGGLGCTVDVGAATAYAARGLNLFQARAQQDVAGLVAPSLDCGLGDSGVSVGWLGAFQISGAGAAALVDDGVGAENDVYVVLERELSDTVVVGAALTAIVYPLAQGELPVYLEPAAHVTWSPGVDLDLELVYSAGVHGAEGVAPYLYVHPTIGREFELGTVATLQLGAGAGWKGYPVGEAPTDNMWDAHVDVGLQKDFDTVYVAPAVHAAWTNLEGRTPLASSFVWGSVNVGVSL